MKNENKLKKFAQNLGLLILSLIVLYLFLEIIIRIFYPQNLYIQKFDKEFEWVFVPNSRITYYRPQKHYIEINSKGLRESREYEYEKSDKFRILSFGDSFAFGAGVNSNETMLKALGRMIDDPRVETINFGVGGWDISRYYLYLEKEGIKYHPDVVLINIYIGNDFSKTSFFEVNNSELTQLFLPEQSNFLKFRYFLAKHSHFYVFLVELLASNRLTTEFLVNVGFFVNESRSMFGVFSIEEYQENFKRTSMILEKFDELSKNNNFSLVYVLIPTKGQVDENAYNQFYDAQNIKPILEKDQIQNDVIKLMKSKNWVVIDLLPGFKSENINNKFYYNNDIHWNAKGYELAAKIVYESLKKDGIIKK